MRINPDRLATALGAGLVAVLLLLLALTLGAAIVEIAAS